MADHNPPESGSRPADDLIAVPETQGETQGRTGWHTVKGSGRKKAEPTSELTYRPRRRGSPTAIAGTAFAKVTPDCPAEV